MCAFVSLGRTASLSSLNSLARRSRTSSLDDSPAADALAKRGPIHTRPLVAIVYVCECFGVCLHTCTHTNKHTHTQPVGNEKEALRGLVLD